MTPARRILIAAALTLCNAITLGVQPDGLSNPVTPPEDPTSLSPLVRSAITAPYLKPDEARALRLKHGVPTQADLTDPALRAVHAIDRHAWNDPALSDAAASTLDRAEAALQIGDLARVDELLKDLDTPRAIRLNVERADLVGDADRVIALAAPLAERLGRGEFLDPEHIVEVARCAAILTRTTRTIPAGADHRGIMAQLARARQIDQFYAPAYLLEAELLFEKDNYTQAREAAVQAVSFNPSCAAAWALVGHLSVNAFDMDSAKTIASRLDELASMSEVKGDDVAPAVSVDAAAIRARAALRQDDPDHAEAALTPVLALFPTSPLLNEMGVAVTAARYDWPALDARIESFVKSYPNSPRAEYRAGQVLADLRQYGPGAKYLARAAEKAPHWPAPRIDLGLLEVQSGRDDRALDALQSATAMDPFNVRAANSLKLLREVTSFERVSSEHFIIRAKPGVDALLAKEMLPIMEQNHAAVTGQQPGSLDHEPADKTIIDLMPDHQWFAVRIAGLPKIHTIAASTGPIIAMEAPREGPKHTGLYDWPRVLRHEYTHTVGLARTGNRMPHWFTEAQAQYLERSPRDWNTVQLLTRVFTEDELFNFDEINIAFTRPKKPTDRSQAYAQGQWMYEYLVERFGAKAPLDLMDRYARGVREEAAFAEVCGISREQFMTDFKPWARAQLKSWGMVLDDALPSLESLIDKLPKDKEGNPPDITDDQIAAWLVEFPKHPDVLQLAAQRAIENFAGQVTKEAAPILERYAAARPVDPMPRKHLAKLYLNLDKPEQAIEHLTWLDAREDRTPIYASQLAGMYAQAGRWDQAGVFAERATRMAPYAGSHRELAAMIAIKRADYPGARRHLEFLVALEPDREQHRKRLEALKRIESEGAR